MAYSLLYPDKVEGLCSLDSPPVDRNEFPEMNTYTLRLVESALEILPSLESKTYKEAWNWLKSIMKLENKPLIASMMMNLDKSSQDRARLLINIEELAKKRSIVQIMGFPLIQDHSISDLSPEKMLFINGEESMQIEIANDIAFYQPVYHNAIDTNLHIVNNAGHEVHF
jgi:pimeloyl-ACP methyl ester carboxylesterase